MTSFRRSFEGLLAWRCGYAAGLQAALEMMRHAQDPEGRIEREFRSATAEARAVWTEVGEPTMKQN